MRSHLNLAPRPQICLMKFTGFVCSLSNELNSKTSFYSTMQMFVFDTFVWHKLDSCDKVSNQCRARLNLRQYLFVQEQLRKGTADNTASFFRRGNVQAGGSGSGKRAGRFAAVFYWKFRRNSLV